MNDISFRREQPADYRAVEELTRAAFWNHYAPGCDEHYLVHIMRNAADFIADLDVVAMVDGRIVASILYTKAAIACDSGEKKEVLCFGPVSVSPKVQGRGIGTRLIEHTQALARNMGYRAILIYGDPEFYKRVGFVPAETYRIGTADDTYADALLACELAPGALSECAGRFIESPVFQIDPQKAAAFDARFPQREKQEGLVSQRRFLDLAQRRRPRERTT